MKKVVRLTESDLVRLVKKTLNENMGTKKNLDSFDQRKNELLRIAATRLVGLYKRDGIIDEELFSKIESLVNMIYTSIDGETGPRQYQMLLDKYSEMDLSELIKNLQDMVLKLCIAVDGFFHAQNNWNFKEAERKLYDIINPLSKTVLIYLDMIKDKNS